VAASQKVDPVGYTGYALEDIDPGQQGNVFIQPLYSPFKCKNASTRKIEKFSAIVCIGREQDVLQVAPQVGYVAFARLVKPPEHNNGNTSATPGTVTDVTFTGALNSILIHNRHDLKNLYVSFDGGTNFKTIEPRRVLVIFLDKLIYQFKVKGEVASQPYECLGLI